MRSNDAETSLSCSTMKRLSTTAEQPDVMRGTQYSGDTRKDTDLSWIERVGDNHKPCTTTARRFNNRASTLVDHFQVIGGPLIVHGVFLVKSWDATAARSACLLRQRSLLAATSAPLPLRPHRLTMQALCQAPVSAAVQRSQTQNRMCRCYGCMMCMSMSNW